jgi:uncharacterized phage protein (TIGR02220 family)
MDLAKYRNVQFEFWTDSKIIDDFTPEDRYFYLYLMTNPHTSLCGCYEINVSQMALETGYQKDVINKLIVRFTEVHDVIRYDCRTKEMLILNWYKYNWHGSEKTMIAVEKGISTIKNNVFREYLVNVANGNTNVSIGYTRGIVDESIPHSMSGVYPLYVTFTFLCNDEYIDTFTTDSKDNHENLNKIKEIVDYFNTVTGKKYKSSSKSTQSHINARLEEGFTIEDFKRVVDVKNSEWKDNPKMAEYLRPETLFGTKFEGYLNQNPVTVNNGRVKLEDL